MAGANVPAANADPADGTPGTDQPGDTPAAPGGVDPVSVAGGFPAAGITFDPGFKN